MTKRKKIFSTLMVMCMALSLSGSAFAEDLSHYPNTEDGASVDYDEPQIDRVAMIDELVHQWGSDDITAYQLRTTLELADDNKLLAVWQADSLDEINSILRGKALNGPLALGDVDQDYVFTPVTPCRIVDTRNAGGIMSAGSRREFFVWGDASSMNPQGGNPAGCPSPVGEPLGVNVNITAVEQISSGGGHLRAFPANEAPPKASILNFMNGQNAIANAAAVKTYFNMGSGFKELEIYSSQNTHVVIDVMGYYSRPGATMPQYSHAYKENTFPASVGNFTFYSNNCPTGYRWVSGGSYAISGEYLYLRGIFRNPSGGERTGCQYRKGSSAAGYAANCWAYCVRVPGR